MDMIVGLIDSYGYGSLIGGAAAHHLSSDFAGGQDEVARQSGIGNGSKVVELAMQTRGSSPIIAGDLSLADLYLAPIAFYVSLTPEKDTLFQADGFSDWWAKIQVHRPADVVLRCNVRYALTEAHPRVVSARKLGNV